MSKKEEESDHLPATPNNLGEDGVKPTDIDDWNDDDETVGKHSFEPSGRRSD